MPIEHDSTVIVKREADKLPDTVLTVDAVKPETYPGCTVFSYFNGPTDQLSGVSTGMVILASWLPSAGGSWGIWRALSSALKNAKR